MLSFLICFIMNETGKVKPITGWLNIIYEATGSTSWLVAQTL